MKVSSYVYMVLNIICYVMLCEFFIESFEQKRAEIKNSYRYLILAGFTLLIFCVTELFTNYALLNGLVVCGLTILVMYIIFNSRFKKIFMLALLYQSSYLILYYISIFLIKKFVPEIFLSAPDSEIYAITGIICQNLLFYLVVLFQIYIEKSNNNYFKESEQIRIIISGIFSVIFVFFNLNMFIQGKKNEFGYITIILLIFNVIMSDIISHIMKRSMQSEKEKLIREKERYEAKLYRVITENYSRQRKREHEYKNQIFCITALAREEKYQELNKYLNEIDKNIINGMDCIDTNHPVINSILNQKFREAKEKNILMVVKVSDLSRLPIVDEDIVTILSNLLNNAIEACEQCENKVIKLKFIQEGKKIVISVMNSMNSLPQKNGDVFQTSKKEHPEEHGVGILNICETVEKYDGSYVVEYNNKEFYFTILIFGR